jgi:hypothetical protein
LIQTKSGADPTSPSKPKGGIFVSKRSIKTQTAHLVSLGDIERRIFMIRGHRVMLDIHLAQLYEVKTKMLNRAMKRNLDRFPDDFTFQLTPEEFKNLRFHFGTSSFWGGRRYLPYAFTEQGVSMLSSVLRSKRAVRVNIEIMRAFVRLRRWLLTHEELSRKLMTLEKKYDSQFKVVFDAIRKLMTSPPIEPEKSKPRIGFQGG